MFGNAYQRLTRPYGAHGLYFKIIPKCLSACGDRKADLATYFVEILENIALLHETLL